MKTKIVVLLALSFIISGLSLFAQEKENFKAVFEEADGYFPKEKTINSAQLLETSKKALPLYLQLLKLDPKNYNVNYRVGRCYLNSRTETTKAIPYLEQAVMSTSNAYKQGADERNAPLVAYVFLGDAYHLNYQFDKAIAAYEKFKTLAKDNKKYASTLKEVNRKIEMNTTAKKLVASPVNFEVKNLGKSVNSAYADYSPVLSADESILIFTSRKPGGQGGVIDEEGNYYEDIYLSTKTDTSWADAKNIGPPINNGGHDASIGMSADGQQILIYKDDSGDGNIYSTSLNGDAWSVPEKLNSNINSIYWEPSGFLAADGNTLYFISNRPGGFGGRDIYKSKKMVNGEWDKAVNLGNTVNTPYDEDAPFIHPDGVTMFFSSNGHKTMGGFDVFSSTLVNDSVWSEPVNVGYPINTPNDDVFYIVSPDKKRAYFSSFRKEGLGEKDIYLITFKEPAECPSLSMFKGVVLDSYGSPAKNVQIVVSDNTTGKVIGTFHTNATTGKYLFILPPGKNYNISYEAEGYLFYSENRDVIRDTKYCEITKEINLPALTIGSKVVLNNIFFDFDKATLRRASDVELEKVVRFLNDHPTISVEISGFTDSKGNDDYNLKLSQARAQAVVKYLTDKGISAGRMVAKGYGESFPSAPNENKDGSDNPESRQLNRRVELKITGV
jgi:outer membrane protein OmpA-like peptidoglycan-associated protein/tetratricopeptide (TPR) repeat protein